MKMASLTEVRNHFSQWVDQVQHGERIRILVHGRAVADLVPVQSSGDEDDSTTRLMATLEGRGVLRRSTSGESLRHWSSPPKLPGTPLSLLVTEDRRDGDR